MKAKQSANDALKLVTSLKYGASNLYYSWQKEEAITLILKAISLVERANFPDFWVTGDVYLFASMAYSPINLIKACDWCEKWLTAYEKSDISMPEYIDALRYAATLFHDAWQMDRVKTVCMKYDRLAKPDNRYSQSVAAIEEELHCLSNK